MGREVQQNCTYHATRDEFRLTSFDGVRSLTRTVPAIPRAPAEAFMLKTDSVSVVQWTCAGTSRGRERDPVYVGATHRLLPGQGAVDSQG
jgi:hypothetical protein